MFRRIRAIPTGELVLLVTSFLVVCASTLLLMHTHGIVRRAWTRTPLGNLVPARGLAYEAVLDEAWHRSPKNPIRVRLLENGTPLARLRSNLDDVRGEGHGSYAIIADRVYFSSSDGTDPRTNGRRYALFWPGPVSYAVVQRLHDSAELCSILLLVLLIRAAAGVRLAADARQLLERIRTMVRKDRAALKDRWRGLLPKTRCGWIALVLFLSVSLPLTVWCRFERSGYVRMTTAGSTWSQSLLGYTMIWDGEPFHKENYPTVKQVLLFCGVMVQRDFYFLRGMYSFLASLFIPFLSIIHALLLTNYLAWAACAYASYRMCCRMYHDELAGVIAVLLVAGGMGPIVHIGDYSAHLLGYATYFLGLSILFESGVWEETRGWEVHMMLAAVLAIASLTYTGSLALIAVYAVLAAPRNRWRHIAAAVAIALAVRPAWHFILLLSGPSLSFTDVEAGYIARSFAKWQADLAASGWTLLCSLTHNGADFLWFDSPVVVAGGLCAIAWLVRPARLLWFHAVSIGLPLCIVLAGTGAASGRGYLVWGISLLFSCALAHGLSSGIRGRPALKILFVPALIATLTLHFGWSLAQQAGYLAPLVSYFQGGGTGRAVFHVGRTETLSMTGHEPTPVLFGGTVSLADAGLVDTDCSSRLTSPPLSRTTRGTALNRLLDLLKLPIRCSVSECTGGLSTQFAWLQYLVPHGLSVLSCLVCRAPFLGLLAFLLFASLGLAGYSRRDRELAVEAFLALGFVLSILAALSTKDVPTLCLMDRAICLRPGGSMTYTVDLARETLERFAGEMKEGDALELWVNTSLPDNEASAERRVFAGSTRVPFSPGTRVWIGSDARTTLAAFARAGQLRLEMSGASNPVSIGGWQRVGLRGREFRLNNPWSDTPGPEVLPSVELRLLSPESAPKLIAF